MKQPLSDMQISALSVGPSSNQYDDALATLYKQHLALKLSTFQNILNSTGYSQLLISSGDVKTYFKDDLFYPFKANAYFKEWVPLNKRLGSFLQISKNAKKPRLFLLCAEDIWHTAPQNLPVGFDSGFDIVEYESLDKIKQQLCPEGETTGFIGEDNPLELTPECCNPLPLLNAIDFERRYKTPYEQHCVRQANRLAIPAHRAAYQAFMAGESELGIGAAYLQACNSSENDMPYAMIVGVNEHAAVLHHFNLDNQAVAEPRSFLLDAGVDYHGYASDITRTHAYDPSCEFAQMIQLMDEKQQELVAVGAIGKNPVELHVLSHQKIAEVLIQFGVVTVGLEEAVESGLTETFYPHGLGHHLGVNVHDKGSQFANAQGDIIPPPENYPKLRHTAPMVANQIHTVEPGLYFIPALLEKLRGTDKAAKLNWSRVEAFIPYGGIRIEDNIVVHEDGTLENLTRDAFNH